MRRKKSLQSCKQLSGIRFQGLPEILLWRYDQCKDKYWISSVIISTQFDNAELDSDFASKMSL